MKERRRHSPDQIVGKPRDADAMLAAGKNRGKVPQALEVSEPALRSRNLASQSRFILLQAAIETKSSAPQITTHRAMATMLIGG